MATRLLTASSLLLLPLFFLVGCGSGGGSYKCTDNGACNQGYACIGGTCEEVECLARSDCPYGMYCDIQDYSCQDGCRDDSDCYAGQACENRECVSASCTNTQVDCGFGEFCDLESGTCYDAGELYCQPCDSDLECGGSENYCIQQSAGTYCGVSCTSVEDCPQGYDCIEIQDQYENIRGYNCYAECE